MCNLSSLGSFLSPGVAMAKHPNIAAAVSPAAAIAMGKLDPRIFSLLLQLTQSPNGGTPQGMDFGMSQSGAQPPGPLTGSMLSRGLY